MKCWSCNANIGAEGYHLVDGLPTCSDCEN